MTDGPHREAQRPVSDRRIAASPCPSVKFPKALKPPLEVLEAEAVHAIAAAVPERYRAIVIPGAGLGLRPGELLGLTVDRVDFLRRSVRVDQQGAGEPLKTEASYRTVPLHDVVADALAAHLARFSPHPTLG